VGRPVSSLVFRELPEASLILAWKVVVHVLQIPERYGNL